MRHYFPLTGLLLMGPPLTEPPLTGSLVRMLIFAVALVSLANFCPFSRADSFGFGENAFEIEFVPIGAPGNVADISGSPRGAGSVSYAYRMGKFEISEQMIDKANALGDLGISKDSSGPNKPATSVSWIEAALFVNWLNTSQGYAPAYKFEDIAGIRPPPPNASLNGFALWQPDDPGYDPGNLYRNKLAKYVLPSSDEWYKAAYYDPVAGGYWSFPTGNNNPLIAVASGTEPNTAVFLQGLASGPADIMQAGGLSSYGTMAQGGNVGEWEETEFDLVNDDVFSRREGRGGSWENTLSGLSSSSRGDGNPRIGHFSVGFRVAIIPEPRTQLLLCIGLLGVHLVPGLILSRYTNFTNND